MKLFSIFVPMNYKLKVVVRQLSSFGVGRGRMILFYFVFCLLVSCKKQDNSGFEAITIDVSKDMSVPISEIADDIIKIELETTDDCLLNEIRQVEVFEGYLLVKDRSLRLYVFDMQGNFVRSIGQGGNGPGEYSFCSGFTLDYQNKKIFLRTNIGIMTYDIEGNFLHKYPLEAHMDIFYNNSFFYTRSNKFESDDQNQYNDIYISKFDNNMNVVDSLRMFRDITPIGNIRFSSVFKPIFQRGEDICVYFPRPSDELKRIKDTLYIIDDFYLRPLLSVQLTNSSYEEERIAKIFTTERYVLVNYQTYVGELRSPNRKMYGSQCIYDRRSKKAKYAKDGFVNDVYNGGRVIISPMDEQSMFYYTEENEYSDELRAEPNPTVYIGTFKK